MQIRNGRFGFLSATLITVTSAALMLSACSDGSSSTGSASSSTSTSGGGGMGGAGNGGGDVGGSSVIDIDMKEQDFTCILKWDQVRLFRITNMLGNVAGSLAVANNPGMGDYPVGTVIQLIPNEAMVKRAAGFSAESNDWEFFFLETSAAGTKIVQRGVADVQNQLGGNCLNCHAKATPEYDFVCEKGHGCDPLPFTDDQILGIQNGDPRCMP